MKRHLITAAISLCTSTTLTLSGCAGAGSLGSGEGQTITIAMVSNSQMTDARELSDQFEAQNPGIHLKFVTLSENQARAKITMSTSTGGREFDVVMISNYETPQWAQNGWLTDLEPYIANTPATTRTTSSRPSGKPSRIRTACTRCRSTANHRS